MYSTSVSWELGDLRSSRTVRGRNTVAFTQVHNGLRGPNGPILVDQTRGNSGLTQPHVKPFVVGPTVGFTIREGCQRSTVKI